MIESIIEFSIRNRFVVILLACVVVVWGIYCVINTPVDAIPDLSENQVIVFTDWMGRSPREIEDQITYPLSVNLQGLAGVKAVRSSSEFNFSMINVIFEDNVDFYFARAAGAGAAHPGQHVPAARRDPVPRPGRHGPGSNILVHRGRRRLRPRPAAGDSGLVRPLSTQFRARRGPGRIGGRFSHRISNRRRSATNSAPTALRWAKYIPPWPAPTPPSAAG